MINQLTDQYDKCALECDGLTRVLHTVLSRENIEHTCMIGQIINTKTKVGFSPHFWIELPDGQIIDYRARMWLGSSPDVPHGVFKPTDYPHVVYEGEKVELGVLPQYLFEVLVLPN